MRKKALAIALALSLAVTPMAYNANTVNAATKSKKVTLYKGQTKKYTITGTKSKIKWKVISGKSKITIKTSGKFKKNVKIKGKKAGNAVLRAKCGKKILKFKIKVKNRPKNKVPATTKVTKPTGSNVVYPTTRPNNVVSTTTEPKVETTTPVEPTIQTPETTVPETTTPIPTEPEVTVPETTTNNVETTTEVPTETTTASEVTFPDTPTTEKVTTTAEVTTKAPETETTTAEVTTKAPETETTTEPITTTDNEKTKIVTKTISISPKVNTGNETKVNSTVNSYKNALSFAINNGNTYETYSHVKITLSKKVQNAKIIYRKGSQMKDEVLSNSYTFDESNGYTYEIDGSFGIRGFASSIYIEGIDVKSITGTATYSTPTTYNYNVSLTDVEGYSELVLDPAYDYKYYISIFNTRPDLDESSVPTIITQRNSNGNISLKSDTKYVIYSLDTDGSNLGVIQYTYKLIK